jgi:putative protein-disulfide isomerase
LIYIGDPMCSWCYGFSPELDKIREAFPLTTFEMVMGGLRSGGQETMSDLRAFLSSHWIEVEKASGQRFNHSILKRDDLIYNTEPACRAAIVAKQLNPFVSYEYFKRLQKSFYLDNQVPTDVDVFIGIATDLGIDPTDFKEKFNHRQAKMDAYSEFDLANTLGAQGFPTLIAKINGRLFLVTNGYQKLIKSSCHSKIEG